jgi:hypothetical protein
LLRDIQIVIGRFRRRRRRTEMRARRSLLWRRRLRYTATMVRKRIGLPDQPRQFGQRIALTLRSRLVIPTRATVGGISSVLISISHVVLHPLRESADPSF